MELTKQQRNKVYRDALELYLERIGNGVYLGMCSAIRRSINTDYPNTYYNIESYPEIKKHRPIKCRRFWFDLSDTEPRISILKQAIAETDEP